MNLKREDTSPNLKEFRVDSSWIPTTPAKPNSVKPQLICTQENQHVQCPESERPNHVNIAEAPLTLPTYYSSVNSVCTSEGINIRQTSKAAASSSFDIYTETLNSFDTWKTNEAASSCVYGEDLHTNDMGKWNKMSFGDLLAHVHKAGNSTVAAPENAVTQTHSHPHTENTMSFRNSFVADHETELITMPNIPNDGSSIPSRTFSDLNLPARTVKNAPTSKNLSPQFEPITPEKTSKTENRQENAVKNLITDGITTTNDAQESTITELCAKVNTQLQENVNPEKGGIEEADLSKTPQQKPRRKKHRPKVVKVGQARSTATPSSEKHSDPQETTRAKRKYVRRKEISNSTSSILEGKTEEDDDSNKNASKFKVTPVGKRKYERKQGINKLEATMDKGTTETTEIENLRHTKSSCRRSLKFNLEDQARDENSSQCPSSDCVAESTPDNFNVKDQTRTTKECIQGVDFPCSTYPEVKDRLLRSETTSPSPLTPTKSTSTPSSEKHSDPQETTRAKRKYVRRKEISNTTSSTLEGKTKEDDDSNNNASKFKVTPVGKRKYERKQGINKLEAIMDKGTTETTEIEILQHTRSSCRRSLNFNLEDQARDENSSQCPSSDCVAESTPDNFNVKDQARTTKECIQGVEFPCSTYQEVKNCLLRSERHSPSPLAPTNIDPLLDNYRLTDQSVCTKRKCQIVFSDVTHDKESNEVDYHSLRPPKNPIDSNFINSCLTTEIQNRGLKRNMCMTAEAKICSTNSTGTLHNSMQTYLSIISQNGNKNDCIPEMHFPTVFKKNKADKGFYTDTSSMQYTMTTSSNHMKHERHTPNDFSTQLFTSSSNQRSVVTQSYATNLLMSSSVPVGTQSGRKVFENLLALGPGKRIKKRISKGPAQVEVSRDEAAKTSRTGHEILHEYHKCMEALATETCSTMPTKKGSKSLPLKSTGQDCNPNGFAIKSMGPPLAITWENMSVIDSIMDQLNQLDLNAESRQVSAHMQNGFPSCHMHNQKQHALIPYQRGGAVVPFDDSFHQVRRKQPRAKVDLDDETTRVWNLLLENINNVGIDGTDEEKAKWWEEERKVFTGRAESFIARMHLVQGDRRFSPWKGSVVDSVVGVFLTQNVSDHLSSSAFMSLAAQYPLKSTTNLAEIHEVSISTKMKEPEVCAADLDKTTGLNKKVLYEPVSGEYDEIRVVNSVRSLGSSSENNVNKENLGGNLPDMLKFEPTPNKSTSLVGGGGDTDDTISFVISSQNSADSALAETSGKTMSYSLSNSEEEPASGVRPNRFTSSTSFVKVLEMAGTVLHGVYEKHSDKKVSGDSQQVSESLALSSTVEHGLDDSTSSEKPNTSCGKPAPSLAPNSGTRTEILDLSKSNSVFSVTSCISDLCATEISELSVESESQTTFQKFSTISSEEGPNICGRNAHSSKNDNVETNLKVENQRGQVPRHNLFQDNIYKMQEIQDVHTSPQNLMDVAVSSNNSDYSRKNEHKQVGSNTNDHGKRDAPKSKEGRIEKEKRIGAAWDDLRKKAQEGAQKRERTTNTMDTVDWGAVRSADVNDIAQAIKDRGMNNKLAERIQDFLNRIVTDHGSIDLEWLRDVPPDKAKEYLLSIRGLGLKSVECVRLLTLHHLAFPVDTNVGRIAVRLGWVPLQPLPESLQLHLLELYPVLESIQKYLWPRLCKLDQRTLYELHYQMITFGKVFCTKSKPNCNACPMKGECRHFASAFASARLALPATGEKGTGDAAENKAASEVSLRNVNTLPLPSSQGNHMDVQTRVSNSLPIIEEPATPEPIIEVPDTPEPEHTQVLEFDIEDTLYEDPDEIPTIKLNMEQFTQNLKKVMQQNTELQECFTSQALVALTAEAASIPVPKLKNINRLRTEHQVYELPDSHPLLEGMDKREADDPSPYLLAIWTPGETVDSIQPAETRCSSHETKKLCTDETCLSCNSIRELNSQTVRGTLLIPCRTAMRGSFPLNGTYFQVNEVFSDHESSLNPLNVPREWLWNLPRRTVYFGTTIPTIFKGLTTEGIQYCFWRGFVCVRGFDRTTRAPRPLIARLHFPASKLARGKGKTE